MLSQRLTETVFEQKIHHLKGLFERWGRNCSIYGVEVTDVQNFGQLYLGALYDFILIWKSSIIECDQW